MTAVLFPIKVGCIYTRRLPGFGHAYCTELIECYTSVQIATEQTYARSGNSAKCRIGGEEVRETMRKWNLLGLFPVLVLIGISSVPARAQATWTDPATRLMWTPYDNGKNVNLYQATEYCSNLKLGGYTNWGVPTLAELKSLSGKVDDLEWMRNNKSPVHISNYLYWSKSAGDKPGEAAMFNFLVGGIEASERIDLSQDSGFPFRVLCVRRP